MRSVPCSSSVRHNSDSCARTRRLRAEVERTRATRGASTERPRSPQPWGYRASRPPSNAASMQVRKYGSQPRGRRPVDGGPFSDQLRGGRMPVNGFPKRFAASAPGKNRTCARGLGSSGPSARSRSKARFSSSMSEARASCRASASGSQRGGHAEDSKSERNRRSELRATEVACNIKVSWPQVVRERAVVGDKTVLPGVLRSAPVAASVRLRTVREWRKGVVNRLFHPPGSR